MDGGGPIEGRRRLGEPSCTCAVAQPARTAPGATVDLSARSLAFTCTSQLMAPRCGKITPALLLTYNRSYRTCYKCLSSSRHLFSTPTITSNGDRPRGSSKTRGAACSSTTERAHQSARCEAVKRCSREAHAHRVGHRRVVRARHGRVRVHVGRVRRAASVQDRRPAEERRALRHLRGLFRRVPVVGREV